MMAKQSPLQDENLHLGLAVCLLYVYAQPNTFNTSQTRERYTQLLNEVLNYGHHL